MYNPNTDSFVSRQYVFKLTGQDLTSSCPTTEHLFKHCKLELKLSYLPLPSDFLSYGTSFHLLCLVVGFVTPWLSSIGPGRFTNPLQQQGMPRALFSPILRPATTYGASANLDALRGAEGSRESMWHRRKLIGMVSDRLANVAHDGYVVDDVIGAVVLLSNIEAGPWLKRSHTACWLLRG